MTSCLEVQPVQPALLLATVWCPSTTHSVQSGKQKGGSWRFSAQLTPHYQICVVYITTSIELSRAKAEPSKSTVNPGIRRRRSSPFSGKFPDLGLVALLHTLPQCTLWCEAALNWWLNRKHKENILCRGLGSVRNLWLWWKTSIYVVEILTDISLQKVKP